MAKIVLRAGKVAIKIILLFVVLGLIFYSIKMLTPAKAQTEAAQSALADEMALAETLQEQGNYAEAELIYLGIIEQYLGTDDALTAQTQLAILYINWDRPADADAALEQLTSSFSEHPEIAQAVYDIADCYGEVHKNYEKARELHREVLANWPDSETAIWSQADLAVCNVGLGDEVGAEAAIEKLLTDFSSNENIAKAVCDIATHYVEAIKDYEKARRLYQLALENWPDNENAIRAKTGVISADIALGYHINAAEVANELIEQFSESEFIVEALCSIADSCYEVGKYEDGRRLHQLAAENWPGNDDALLAKASLISLNIALGSDTNTHEAIDELIAEFAENPDLPEVLLEMGVGYYEMAIREGIGGNFEQEKSYYGKAIDVWERIIQDFSDHNIKPQAYYFSAKSYHRIGEHEKAINYYEKLLFDWPEYRRAARAQFSIGKCYESLKDAGTLHGSEADLKIEQAYKNVVGNYPDSASAIDACLNLGWLNFTKGLWPESVHYWELSREKLGVSSKDYKALNILYPLGRAYEELGRFDLSVEAYSEFINLAPSIDPRVEKVKARLEQLALDKG